MNRGNRVYSPFWPVTLLFVVLAAAGCVDIYNLLIQRHSIRARLKAATAVKPVAEAIKATYNNLKYELLLLAPDSPEAAKLVKRFRLAPAPTQTNPAEGIAP